MRREWLFAAAMTLAASVATAAPALFSGATESKWTVTKAGKPIGTVTLYTSGSATRADWRGDAAKTSSTTFLGGQNKVWVRAAGGDSELETINMTDAANVVAPALLLPFTISPNMPVEAKGGKVVSYAYRGAKATYTYDDKGPSRIEVKNADGTYVATRTSLAAGSAAAATFELHPKKSAGSKLARLSGDLLGTSDASVSATAGGRGVGHEGLKLSDGGDYDAVAKLERRDANWKSKLDAALAEFQKDGKVGKERENQ